MLRNTLTALLAAPVILLSACDNDDDLITVTPQGEMSLAVTDAPVDSATSVVVEFTGVEIMHADDMEPESFEFDTPRSIDLLALQGNDSELLLDGVSVEAGEYQWVRLMVNAERGVIDSYIELNDGSQHSLWVPSGSQTGLKLVSGFTVPANTTSNFTIDFNLRKSVHNPEGNFPDYILRPALRLVDNTETGTIAGTVASGIITADCSPVVYLFEGTDVTPDDEDGNEPDPVTSAIPAMNTDTGNFDYEIGFVTEGDYTASFSCDADADDPDTDDAMNFTGTQNVTVVAGETATADFQ